MYILALILVVTAVKTIIFRFCCLKKGNDRALDWFIASGISIFSLVPPTLLALSVSAFGLAMMAVKPGVDWPSSICALIATAEFFLSPINALGIIPISWLALQATKRTNEPKMMAAAMILTLFFEPALLFSGAIYALGKIPPP